MALLKSIEEIQKHVAVNSSLLFQTVEPDINDVDFKIIRKYLGPVLHDQLHQANDTAALTLPLAQLLEKVQPALANLAMAQATTIIQVQISNAGITRTEDDREKTAYKGQIESLNNNYLKAKGWEYIELMLEFLEEQKDSFPAWVNSKAYTVNKQLILSNAIQFSENESIRDNRLTYLALTSIMKDVEAMKLEPVLGELYYEMKQQILSNNVTPENELILNQFIRPATAKYTVAGALTSLPVVVTDRGIMVNQLQESEAITQSTAPDQLLVRKAFDLENKAGWYMTRLKEYLNKHSSETKYATWYHSDLRTPDIFQQIKEAPKPEKRNIYRA
jgi:hypothetical protein